MKEKKAGIAVRAVENALTRLGGKLVDDVTREFSEQRRREAEDLHNAFVDAINNRKPSIETVLYVIRRLEFSILAKQINGDISPAEDAGPVLAREA